MTRVMVLSVMAALVCGLANGTERVPATLQVVKVRGHVGRRIDACFANHILKHDAWRGTVCGVHR